ncbi:MAG TPA: Dna2/Cas4 domain-containing protein, partial [Hanamia sp.]
MNITATHINYYHICHRKLWLFSNGINMEHTSEMVADGKLLHETSYPQRAEKYREIELSATLNNQIELFGKIDFYDAKEKMIHEIKRSEKIEAAHEWQVKFYIWLLEQNDIFGVHAI